MVTGPPRKADPGELTGYADLLADVKAQVHRARLDSVRRANSEVVGLYVAIGRLILKRQTDEGWGTSVIPRLATDLKTEFPNMRGFSARNLGYCRQAALVFATPDLQQLLQNLPWGHAMVLIDQLNDLDLRGWYAAKAVEQGWSRKVLMSNISTRLHERSSGSSASPATPTSPIDCQLVRELVKDPYCLDFVPLKEGHTERELEDALTERITLLLAELGPGFAFVGRQVPLRVGETDFYVDLLFFHLHLRRYVVIELKTGAATPEAIGKLGFYLAVIDDHLTKPELGDGPTIGILLTRNRDDIVVDYGLRSTSGPMAAVTYQALPADVRDALPSPSRITHALLRGSDD